MCLNCVVIFYSHPPLSKITGAPHNTVTSYIAVCIKVNKHLILFLYKYTCHYLKQATHSAMG